MPLFSSLRRRQPARRRHINPNHLLVTTLLLPALALAQDDDEPTSSTNQFSQPFVDQITGLNMERFFGARTSFGFAFALPEAQPGAGAGSFIGQLSFPLVNGQGWGSFGLTGDMEGNFILAVWPDGKGGVMASFRQATNEDSPPEVAGQFRVRPLPEGVSVNSTSLLYTFLCENCLDSTLGLGPEATAGNAVMGWALSERPPRGDPADPGAFLGFHERGFGPFTARLAQAKTAGFDAVAATALGPVGDSGNAVAAVPGAFEDGSGDEDSGDEGGAIGGGRGGSGDGDDSGDDSDDDD
ncbi:CDH-cyt domain-containing protein [Fusarium keratoplasticum]|uniref:CDH-cyt domain-containing protein n=1 Tax=Fusarium keratoplasticum TaxID=1328300 RepID=A0ACC0QC41_9HYPO|nr:CDH-cyt domain-containing protein [Fusarium keratoplasticum]KAI8650454.1 CDH-cyt domain-containing protein [Fusarium keratoplasticum]